jgi:hypothetical protein
MDLFKDEPFVSHAGLPLDFKIECDALSDGSIETIAKRIARNFMFGKVRGVPRGGLRLAAALEKFCSPNCETTIIADDVYTTGRSMEEMRRDAGADSIGVVLWARGRGRCPDWIHPVNQLAEWAGP